MAREIPSPIFEEAPWSADGSVASGPQVEQTASATSSEASEQDPHGGYHRDPRFLKVIGWVSSMQLTRPEVQRATRASNAFQDRLRALRKARGNFFHHSFQCEKIECFWSHSWHGSTWKKILTLLVLYNGPAAIAVGSVVALTAALLFLLELLPGFPRWFEDGQPPAGESCAWSVPCGFMATLLTMILWGPRQTVFFDKICIAEHDERLKAEAILSLAGILRSSNRMLVLWDASWSDRLWCLFELSAFLKSKDGSRSITITPTFMGPASIAVFLTMAIGAVPSSTVPLRLPGLHWNPVLIPMICLLSLGSCASLLAVVAMRSYFRSVEDLKERLRNNSLQKTRSWCCDVGHLRDGQAIPCDREVVLKCIGVWFGSPTAFEEYVRVDVLETMSAELDGGFGRAWCLAVTAPCLWSVLDGAAGDRSGGVNKWHNAVEIWMKGFCAWLSWGPSFIQFFVLLTRYFCQQAKSVRGEIAVNLLVLALALLVLSVLALPWWLESEILDWEVNLDQSLERAAFTVAWTVVYTAFIELLKLCCFPRPISCLNRPKSRASHSHKRDEPVQGPR